jgi:large subunit ribosomal protein L23
MKFNFFKKIWGKKEEKEEKKPEDKLISEEKKDQKLSILKGFSFKIFPLITEKSRSLFLKENKYTFLVDSKVNKDQIKKAIEKNFNVKVISINTLNYQKRLRGIYKIKTKRPKFKKAIVKIAEGQKIDIFE